MAPSLRLANEAFSSAWAIKRTATRVDPTIQGERSWETRARKTKREIQKQHSVKNQLQERAKEEKQPKRQA